MLSLAGQSFLKATLSPPDAPVGEFVGIPDNYDGKVLCKTFTSVTSIPTFTAGRDAFLVSLPIPGYSYFYGESIAGVVALTGVQSDDFATLFPQNYETDNFAQFRFAGMGFEVIPTVNAMTWTGSVQVFRGPVTISQAPQSTTTSTTTIGGLAPLIYSSKPEAVHPFNMGCYCASRPSDVNFPMHPVLTGALNSEIAVSPFGVAKAVTIQGVAGQVIPGLGTMEAIVYKIPGYSATGNVGTIRTWANVEFTVSSASVYYEFARISPPEDQLALALARRAYTELMLCVPFYENDGTWERIWSWVKRAAGMMSFIPGPVGEIASGFSMAATGMDALFL